jgi:glycosyltransferase involved in cell wall biosynthesis
MLVNVTIPVFNEEKRLAASLPKLHSFLREHFRFDMEVVIADNGSTDRTLEICRSMSREYSKVRIVHSEIKGRGRILREVWMDSDAQILSYMDADLSTELEAFPPMIESLARGCYEVAVGSRLLKQSLTTRCFTREFVSRCYNWLVRITLNTHFSDAQCGFKAITREAALRLLPLVKDDQWFFDTELLTLAEKLGYRILDFPVHWREEPGSHVRIFNTAKEDIKGLWRIRRNLRRQAYLPEREHQGYRSRAEMQTR